jgi:hypothetical protein
MVCRPEVRFQRVAVDVEVAPIAGPLVDEASHAAERVEIKVSLGNGRSPGQ